jgi:6-phosphogluconate dehydrogenase
MAAGRARFGMIGLGRMGGNMARRLARAGLAVGAFDVQAAARDALMDEPKVAVADSLAALVASLEAPRVVWLMLPAGAPSETTLAQLTDLLSPGDVVVDGANADFRDTERRAAALVARGFGFADVGVSGGVWGLENGYGLMIGGTPAAVEPVLPYLRALAPAPDRGWVHCGPAGAGHYVKMVHNGIEYGLMQAYAEGFALLKDKREYGLDVAAIAEAWRHGTVIRSWLLDLGAAALRADSELADVAPVVPDSGEGRWTVREAIAMGTPAPVITAALMARFTTQGRDDYAAKFLAELRHAFGGHGVLPASPPAGRDGR